MAAVLAAKGLKKAFGKVIAVDGLDLSIQEGECFALLGPNGAGKTTTVEMLEGLQAPDSGEISLFGIALNAHSRPQILQRVGVLLQETSLYKKLTVKETLQLFASFFKSAAQPEELIAEFDLQEKTNARLEQLSGGQKQRVYLSCALINRPEFVVLDEPTTGLDPQARRSIWSMLEGLKKKRKSILLTTHYMDEAEVLADRVAVVDHGKIIAAGTPAKLIEDVCGEQVLWVSFGGPEEDQSRLQKSLSERLPWFSAAIAQGGGFEVTLRKSSADHVAELNEAARAANIKVESLRMRRTNLEDVFLKLTGRSIRND